jgi:mycothiol synthase
LINLINLINLAIRNYQPADLPALAQLINEADHVDDAGFATTPTVLGHRLAEPGVRPAENLFVAEVDGRLVGYVILARRTEETIDRINAVGIVHPQWRRRGIGTALMQRAEAQARTFLRDKPVFLDMVARGHVAGAAELALSQGLQPVRYFFYMQCHDLQHLPEPAFPPDIRLRTFVLGQDEEEFVRADNDGFSDHWGFVPVTLEQIRHLLGLPGVRADNWLLAVDPAGHIAGFCLLLFPEMDPQMLRTNPPLIDDLAVIHAYRRRGIGRALLLAGMHHIRSQGFAAAALAVDADNPNQALRLYESVGFVVVSPSTAYRKELVTTEGAR